MPTVQSWPALLDQLLNGESLSAQQATALMQGWLSEQIDPVLTGGLLAALRAKGVSGEELAAMAEVLREACPMPASRPALALVDTCGTGGDGADSFNISTAVAFVAAACGAHVAKHGNRSASGRVGSADVLEAVGIHLQAPQEQVIGALPRCGGDFFVCSWLASGAGGAGSPAPQPGGADCFQSAGPIGKSPAARCSGARGGPA